MTLFLDCAIYLPSTPYGVLLMTVSSDGVDGRPADVGGRTSHSRGRMDGPGDTTTRAHRAVGLLSFEATAEELSIQRRSPAGITGAARRLSLVPQGSAHRAGQRPRLPSLNRRETFSPWGTNATPAKDGACPLIDNRICFSTAHTTRSVIHDQMVHLKGIFTPR